MEKIKSEKGSVELPAQQSDAEQRGIEIPKHKQVANMKTSPILIQLKSALLIAAFGLLVSGGQLVQSSGYGQEGSSYASSGPSYGGSDGGNYAAGGYDDHASGASYGVQAERPRVNLGISLKVPAMKINLGRMNMPRISIRAKIKQSHAPKVINVPEMHIDTNSKIPGPQGAQAVNHGGDSSYGSSSSYGGGSSSYSADSSYGSSGSSSYGGGSSSYGGSSPAPSYGQSASNYGQSASSYGQAAPSYGGGSSSYGGGAPSGPSYGSVSAPSYGSQAESAGGYSAPSQGYGQGSSAGYGPAGGHEMPTGGYEAAAAAGGYESGSSYGAGGQGGSSYESAEPSYAPAASYSQPTSYSDAPAPTNYGRKPTYGASSAPVATGGYGPAGPSNYGGAVSNAGYSAQARPQASTRSQYGSSASAYNAPQQSYANQASSSRSAAYGAGPSNSYAAGQQTNAASGYRAAPAATNNAYSQAYSAPTSSGGYQASRPAPSYNQAPAFGSRQQQSYGSESGYSNVPSTYEPAGYQPLEPGHTLITASNDNYDGLTQMAVASNPPKEHPKYPAVGPSVSYENPTAPAYGASNGGSGYGQKAAPAAPAYSSQAPSGPSYEAQSNQYNANQQQSYQPPTSQPIYDDSAASAEQGNYGARMGPLAQAGNYVEAY